jgi:hypothetical protein
MNEARPFLKISQFIDILHCPPAELPDRYLSAAIFCRTIKSILSANRLRIEMSINRKILKRLIINYLCIGGICRAFVFVQVISEVTNHGY